ncbi:MAG TPA: hypothetical protein P5514_05015 [Bacteroidales bacterium]|nr:hypothetical protein [Bacteroidales bacterium]HRX96283.1 hypothetical protein [Bacteroidales bacterium]
MKNKINHINISLFLLTGLLLSSVSLFSQEVNDNEEITVVAPYQPTVSDAFKINISPRIPDEKLEKPKFNYEPIEKTLSLPAQLEPIVPARIEGESVSKLYKNYIRAGFGNYGTPYIEFFANKLRSKKNAFGVHIKHISHSGKIKDFAYPGNSHSSVDFYGKKFLKKHTFSADVFAKRDGYHFYGYRPDDFPELDLEKKDIKQNYTLFGVNTAFESNYTREQSLHHNIGFNYYYLFDRAESTEHNIHFMLDLDKKMEFFSFSEMEKLGLNGDVNFYLNNDTINGSFNSGLTTIAPYYSLQFDQYLFRVGVNTAIQSDSGVSVHVYPELRLEVKVVEDYLITYAGIDGRMEQNSLRSFSDENPFINSALPKQFTNYKSRQFGGLKGRITKYLDYNVSFMNSTISDMPLFVNDTASVIAPGLNNQFTVIYDRVKYTRLLAEFGFHYKSKFNAILSGQYNNYFLDNEDKAWHKPGLELKLATEYTMQEKILLRLEILNRSSSYAKLYETEANDEIKVVAQKINGFTDVNLGVEYRYNQALSGFISMNNLLSQRQYLWYNYPSYRFNVLLGATYSF